MNLFIDEDSVQALLVRLLGKAGHDLITSLDVGLGGHADAMQLTVRFARIACCSVTITMTSKTCTC